MDRSSLKINRACHQPWPGPRPPGAQILFPLLMITVKMMDIFERNSTTFSLIRTAEHATSNQHKRSDPVPSPPAKWRQPLPGNRHWSGWRRMIRVRTEEGWWWFFTMTRMIIFQLATSDLCSNVFRWWATAKLVGLYSLTFGIILQKQHTEKMK